MHDVPSVEPYPVTPSLNNLEHRPPGIIYRYHDSLLQFSSPPELSLRFRLLLIRGPILLKRVPSCRARFVQLALLAVCHTALLYFRYQRYHPTPSLSSPACFREAETVISRAFYCVSDVAPFCQLPSMAAAGFLVLRYTHFSRCAASKTNACLRCSMKWRRCAT